MAGEYARTVDYQLASARVQLDLARVNDKGFSRTACLNACCLHLAEAMLAYLHELRLSSCVSLQNGSSLTVILGDLKNSTEPTDFRVKEIFALAFSRQSWMSNLIQLQLYFRKPTLQEQKRQVVETQPAAEQFIATSANQTGRNSSGEGAIAEPSIDLLAEIIDGLGDLVTRHRELSAEY